MTQRVKHRRRSTLHVIGGLLIASAFLRILDGSGQAFAEGNEKSMVPVENQEEALTEDTDISSLLGALQAREARVAEQETALRMKSDALAVAEAEIAEQLATLEAAEISLRSTIALAEAASETDLGRLTAVYENMKPKDAAALFEEMDPDFAAGFLGMMRPEPAALVMSQLAPQTAHSISVFLAGRNAGVPTQ